MNQIFASKDQRRKWEGCRSYFYAREYQPVGTKSRELLHIHFINPQWEVKVYLLNKKYLEIEKKWGQIPKHYQTKLKEFMKENYEDILAIIRVRIAKIFPDWEV